MRAEEEPQAVARIVTLILAEAVVTLNLILPFVFALMVSKNLSTPKMVVVASFSAAITWVVALWLMPVVWREL